MPADFNHDGRLDLLVMSEVDEGGWWNEVTELSLEIYTQNPEGGFGQCHSRAARCPSSLSLSLSTKVATLLDTDAPISLPRSTLVQPMVLDATGNLTPDLLGLLSTNKGKTSTFKLWQNSNGNFTPLVPLFRVCVYGRTNLKYV